MKKSALFIVLLLLPMIAIAGDVINRTEQFKDGVSTFGFEPISTRKQSVSFDGECMLLTAKKETCITATRFPLNVRNNFKVTYHLTLPNLKSDAYYLLYNFVENEENILKSDFDAIVISEDYLLVVVNGSVISKHKIKLKKGKNVPVSIDVEKKGRRVILSVNGVDFEEPDVQFKNSVFGFMVTEKESLKVNEINIFQHVEDD